MNIYLDNAATTALEPRVLNAMIPYWKESYGNPSSSHAFGREAKKAVEGARRTIADLFNASPSEIFFTSGATESDNLAITGSIRALNIRNAISTRIEHHAVLNCLQAHEKNDGLKLNFVHVDEKGHLEVGHLVELLQKYPHSLVSLMHGNNEIGNLNDIATISELCRRYGAVFHSDTVQTVGSYGFNLKQLKVDFIVGSAHKFHGPKGIGFVYINNRLKPQALLQGGGQERNLRPGTENVAGIVGLAKALEIAHQEREQNRKYIQQLKSNLIRGLLQLFPTATFLGDCTSVSRSMYTVVNVSLPKPDNGLPLLNVLDRLGVAASGGSACNSKAGSHVLNELAVYPMNENIRFSLSKFNTEAEIASTLDKLSQCYQPVQTLAAC